MKIRAAVEDDLDAASTLFDQYRQFYKQHADLAACKSFLSDRLRNGDATIFLAFNGAEPIGFAQLYPSFSSLSLKRLWILNDLFVRPSHRGMNVGKALMEACHDYARLSGAKGLVLQTASDNEVAQNLYCSMGWNRDTRFLSYYYSLPTNGEN